MQENLQIQDIFNIIKKRLFLIISITLLSVASSGLVSHLWLTPIYEASTQLLINQKKTDNQSGGAINVQENLELINTYRVIIKSHFILDIVKTKLNLDRSLKELGEQIRISSEQNSQVVTISVQDPDPAIAVGIANTTATVFMNEIKPIMNIDNVTILTLANEENSSEPIKPSLILNMLIALILSLIILIGFVFLLEYLDDTLKSEENIRSYLELPVLGSIPNKNPSDFELESRNKTKSTGGKRFWGYIPFLKRKKK